MQEMAQVGATRMPQKFMGEPYADFFCDKTFRLTAPFLWKKLDHEYFWYNIENLSKI